ncbi:MAG: hypothetical protein RL420_1224 [Pseudomonadota bacterium]
MLVLCGNKLCHCQFSDVLVNRSALNAWGALDSFDKAFLLAKYLISLKAYGFNDGPSSVVIILWISQHETFESTSRHD